MAFGQTTGQPAAGCRLCALQAPRVSLPHWQRTACARASVHRSPWCQPWRRQCCAPREAGCLC
eukprot:363205-Chlamydomonas_euryale.AAC.2